MSEIPSSENRTQSNTYQSSYLKTNNPIILGRLSLSLSPQKMKLIKPTKMIKLTQVVLVNPDFPLSEIPSSENRTQSNTYQSS